ncbi:YhbD family protein [Paenibacillus filicis]|uniref:YhbD family protein n=1 Tax=Paenibacillus gyeongsangnamensis TaxID=3388067 RepID=A0ABT4QCN2_9BACL|nr:YhbD family protein [Paenibacillus filicis]MCZ8514639.1 YhbD family protein [Paenibacillus filicis]
MEQQLISKKDLLELTGISYGQLYRWKRKNLIPEEWFIRKSTFTGQETFFPKEQILARIDKILNMKDDLSLDELADVFSPNLVEASIPRGDLEKRGLISPQSLQLFEQYYGDTDVYTFDMILHVYLLDKLLRTGEITLEEGRILLETLQEHYPKFKGMPCELVFFRKMGVSGFLLSGSPNELYFEKLVRMVARIPIAASVEELKMKLS